MTGNEYQELAKRTINENLYNSQVEMHALHGMASEVGELHAIYQKLYQGHAFDKEHVMRELGDLMWFIAEYCTVMGFELDKIMELNIEKLKLRYPEGFDSEHSLHRENGDI